MKFSHRSHPNVSVRVTFSLTIRCWLAMLTLQMRVGRDTTEVQLVKLLPNTAYTLSLFALHGESASEPLTNQGVTRM